MAGGAAVLNQVYERDTDALMRRTRLRPLPDQRVTPEEARTFGTLLAAGRYRAPERFGKRARCAAGAGHRSSST